MSKRAGIFDLDGTLVDTYDAHLHAWKSACVPYGIDITLEQFARDFGRANPPIIRALWNDGKLEPPTDELIAEVADKKEALFRSVLAKDFRPMPGAGWRLPNIGREPLQIRCFGPRPQARDFGEI